MKKALVALIVALALAAPVVAGTLAGITLPDSAKVGDQSLLLNGMAIRTKLWIKVYVAGLYLPAKQGDGAKILAGDTAHRMVMSFLYDVSKEQICEAWDEGLTLNSPTASPQVRQDFTKLCTFMDGVGKNVEVLLDYLPGSGTTVTVGGAVKGTIPGAATADAILATWIGANPAPGAAFKKALLGN